MQYLNIFKQKKVAGVLVAMLLALSAVPFSGTKNASAAVELQRTSLTTNESRPAASGKYLAYVDSRDGTAQLYVYDISLKTEKRLTAIADPNSVVGPYFSGNYLVWAAPAGVATAINAVYVPSGESAVFVSTGLKLTGLSATPEFLYYTLLNDKGVSDVYEFKVNTRVERRLTNDDAYQSAPSAEGPVAVWTETAVKLDTLPVAEKQAWTTKVIVAQPAGEVYTVAREYRDNISEPKISGHNIVWTEVRNGKKVIVRYNYVTNQETQISESDRNSYHPVIFGDHIAYLTERNGSTDIVTYDIRNESYYNVTWDSAEQTDLAVAEDRLSWTDDRMGNKDIFSYEFYADGNAVDQDADGVSDAVEAKQGSNRYGLDTDNDGLSDNEEILSYHTKPTDYDTDSDGFSDGEEVKFQGTNPVLFDTDGDGYGDKTEVLNGFSPLVHARMYAPYGKKIRLPEGVETTGSVALYESLNRIMGKGQYTVSDADWHGFVMASIYGHYTPREIAKAIAYRAPTVHPTMLAEEWRGSSAYLAYVRYGTKAKVTAATVK